jgi:hypothetical protein
VLDEERLFRFSSVVESGSSTLTFFFRLVVPFDFDEGSPFCWASSRVRRSRLRGFEGPSRSSFDSSTPRFSIRLESASCVGVMSPASLPLRPVVPDGTAELDPGIGGVEVEGSLALSDGVGVRIALMAVEGVGVDLASVGSCRDWPIINGVGALRPGITTGDPLVGVMKLRVRPANGDTWGEMFNAVEWSDSFEPGVERTGIVDGGGIELSFRPVAGFETLWV